MDVSSERLLSVRHGPKVGTIYSMIAFRKHRRKCLVIPDYIGQL